MLRVARYRRRAWSGADPSRSKGCARPWTGVEASISLGGRRGIARLSPRPRILFFTPTLLVGGAERHTVELCLRLREQGFPARILVHQSSVSPIMAVHPAAADALVLGLRGMSDAKGWTMIWKVLRRERPDIIVAVNQAPLIISILQRWGGRDACQNRLHPAHDRSATL